MRLLEHQGKALFRRYGIPVPVGAVWPDLPDGAGPLVVKAQVPAGGRGKRGGIRIAGSRDEAAIEADSLIGTTLGEHRIDQVYVEERLDVARQCYLAVTVDRDLRRHVVLASAAGGIDVESAARDRLLRLPVDPLAGLTEGDVARAAAFLGAGADPAAAIVRALYGLAVAEDAELAEINPLVATGDGDWVAADAKVILDASAAFRHPEWRDLALAPEGSDAERAIGGAGAVAVEVNAGGRIVGVVSGAGLMMATLDLIAEAGVPPRMMIDLGGVVLAGPVHMVPVFEAIGRLGAPVTFINAYMQTALCDHFAQALAEAFARSPFGGRVVIRLKGRRDAAAADILAPLGFQVHRDFAPALAAAIIAGGT
jgi:succinyl-CoA synthetase beta subunit